MKTLLLLTIATLTSCTTTTTQTVMPNGSTVTITAKSADPVAIAAAIETAKILEPAILEATKKQTP